MSYKSSSMPQRSSPFRRPASPSSPSAFSNRANTPPSSRAAASPLSSPSKLKHSYTVSEEDEEDSIIVTPTKSNGDLRGHMRAQTEPPPSPSPKGRPSAAPRSQHPTISASRTTINMGHTQGDSLSKLPPGLLHSLRESFSVLDSTSNGAITPSSVHETLQSLGLSTNEMVQLFPPGQPQQMALPQYLNSLADMLVGMSSPQELLNAFSAFDDDDSGQIDVAELRRALLETPPEPGERSLTERDIDEALRGYTGRRILGRSAVGIAGVKGMSTPSLNKKGGDVFRYHEFVGNLTGASHQAQQQGQTVQT